MDSLLVQTKKQHESFVLPRSQVDWIHGIPRLNSYVKKPLRYIPLLEMDKCQSLEEKLAAPASKRRKNTKEEAWKLKLLKLYFCNDDEIN